MRIDIWSDVVCPWCYIGKRRLERALAGFPHADEVEVVWHSYELDPSAPTRPTELVSDALGRKYGGGPDAGRQMVRQVEGVAAEEGLAFRHADALHANTRAAHRLLHLALAEGGPALQGALKEALLAAYFVDARNVADADVLTAVATGVGLDEARVRAVLAGREYDDEVDADIDRARAYGAGGVPFYVVDGKYGVSGAQPSDVFARVLDQAWSASHPSVTMVAGAEGADACGPDGCAI